MLHLLQSNKAFSIQIPGMRKEYATPVQEIGRYGRRVHGRRYDRRLRLRLAILRPNSSDDGEFGFFVAICAGARRIAFAVRPRKRIMAFR
ncbi:hypothetical protein BC937DRAFT_86404 [Endogone sp. FLAS-F59071]|nr:hypothetical protein BC937DRAFT_86404 [Endogone sp. FLAS-F59071]|eukprot:RUS20079.1 hypothetical protein BC937DRAFT_86404 [Endogone sp. FLAS-F59071]